eukprot:TRINITY_DN20776_c0_g1_i3.p1 TRINITY_DN20776_c0_g1~~TRINITY_DN20776_c0_g1_i3.p1  ORF type:complete len:387 (-),score=80.97 TRINITY_DN20776_c0_g1_i3:57-1217(-)
MKRAFDFTLDHVGLDPNSSQIWRDYIAFLKSQEATNTHQQGEKNAMIRKIYQQALGLPLTQIEQVWKEYDTWEHSLNKDLAKEMLSKMQQKFINAKTSKRDRKRKSDPILFHMLARPPAEGFSTHLREYKQVLYWKQWIEFEKTNPQKLDNDKLRERVDFTYRQALMTLRHYPEIWYDYAMFYSSMKSFKDSERILRDAVKTLPENLLLNFIFGEFLESQKNFNDARQIYEDLIARSPMPLCYIQMMKFARRSEGVGGFRQIFVSAVKNNHDAFEVYVAAAAMEHQWNKQSAVAAKIYNLGMRKHGRNVKYLLSYLDFLNSLNDHNNMRVVIEQALKDLPPEDVRPIWDRFVGLQYAVGDLAAIQEIESRRAAALNTMKPSGQVFA